MKRIATTAIFALATAGCLPGSGSETSDGEEAVQVGRWVEPDTTTFGSDNIMGLLVDGGGAAKIFYVNTSGSETQVVELTAVVSWEEEVSGEFALQLACAERHLRDANGGNRRPDTCAYQDDFAMLCPLPDAGDGAEMTCTSPTSQWVNYPFRWVRTPAE